MMFTKSSIAHRNRGGSSNGYRGRRKSHLNCRTSHGNPAYVNRICFFFLFHPFLFSEESQDPSNMNARFALKFRRTRAVLVNLAGLDRMAVWTKDRKGRHRETVRRRSEKRRGDTRGHRDRWITGSRVGYTDCPRLRDTFRVTRMVHDVKRDDAPFCEQVDLHNQTA